MPCNTIGKYSVYFTATKDGYSVTSNPKKLTVTKPNLSNAEITFRNNSNESTYEPYNATTTAPGFTVTYNGKTLKLGVDYTASGTASSAGVSTQRLTIKAVEGSDYTGSKTAEWKIVPHKAKVEVGDVIKAYDGTTDLPDGKISLVSAAGSAGYQAGRPLPLSEGNGFELTDAKYDSANASETEKNISFTVKLTDTNYTFEDGTTEKAFTLNGAELNDKTFKINPATIDLRNFRFEQIVYNDLAKTYGIDLKQLLDKLLLMQNPAGVQYGKIQYQGCDYHFTSSNYLEGTTISVSNDGILTLPIASANTATANTLIGTLNVNVNTTNYGRFRLPIEVKVRDRIKPIQSDDFKISATGITYRQTLENSTLTVEGTMKDPTTQEEVKGTFAWKNKYDLPINTGDVYFDWTFTPDESYSGIYAAVTDIVKVPVAPKSIEGATITLEKDEFAYNAAEQSPKITGVTLENWDETRITYVIKSGDKATDVSDRITLTIEGTGNYTGTATVEWKITPKTVTPTIEVEPCTYTGDALEPTVTVKDDIGNIIDQKEYEIFYSNNTNAGIATVTIKDVEGGNYVLSGASKTFEITKAAAPTMQPIELTVINGLEKTYLVNLPALPTLGDNCKYGSIKYEACNFNLIGEGGYANSMAMITSNDEFQLTVPAVESQTEGSVGTVGVKITTDNYQDMILTVEVIAKNKIVPVLDGEITATPITFGQILRVSTITGTMKDDGKTVEGTFEWTNPSTKPDKAGDYQAEWTFTPAKGYEEYATATGTVTIKVNKATPTFNAPTAQENLTYTGQEQALITAGSVTSGGTMQYSLTENGTYSQDIPTGTDAGTYNVWYRVIGDANHNDTAPASVPVRIGKKPLPPPRGTAASKTYDGTTNAGITSVTFDNVTLNRGTDYTVTASFDDAGVGNDKNVTATVTLMGQVAKNYALEQSSFLTTGSITAKEVKVTITPNGGTYGSVTAAAAVLSGVVDGETVPVTLTYTGNDYNSTTVPVNAGSYTVTASITNNNYTLTENTTAEFVITTKAVTVSGITAKDKVYDGTTDAVLDCSNAQFGGILENDKLTVTAKGVFEKTEAGKRNVAISDLTLGGNSVANYVLAESGNQTKTTATITKKQITVTITSNGGTYGETIAPATVKANDVVGEDTPTITLTYTGTANDGTEYTGTTPPTKAGTYTVTATTTDNNYTLDAKTITAEFTVAKRRATVTPDDKQSKVYEEKDPELTYKVSGVLDDETLKGITLTRAEGENAGEYAITATADAGANPNYDVTLAKGKFTINPKPIDSATVKLGKGLIANGAEQTQTVEKVLLYGKEIPADSYTVAGNTATAPGKYTLTVTAKGNYTGTVKQTYAIAPAKAEDAPTGSGKVNVNVQSEGAVPPAALLTDKAELLAMLVDSGDITADELAQIADGAIMDIVLTVKEANVHDEVKTAMAQAAKGCTIGQYLDISLFKYMTVNGSQQAGVPLHTTKDALTISVVMPDALIHTDSAVNRNYCIVRNHEGTITVLDAAFDAAGKTLTFKTDRFSIYAIAYKDTAVPSSGSNPGSNNSSNDSETKKNEVAAPTPAPTPASTSKPSTITAMPQTGDTSNPTLYVVLLVASLLGLAVVFVCKKRNDK